MLNFCNHNDVDRKDMSAVDFNMLEDSSAVELESKEVLVGRPPITCCTEYVRPVGDLANVLVQLVRDAYVGKKASCPVRRSTRGASSVGATSQSSDPVSIDSGDEDDVDVIASLTGIKLVKTEGIQEIVRDVVGVFAAPSKADISAMLKKLNESKQTVEKRTQMKVSKDVVSGSKQSKASVKKKVKVGLSKPIVEEVEEVVEKLVVRKGKGLIKGEASAESLFYLCLSGKSVQQILLRMG
ncbi:hypothetical protein Hanom_Chr05g00447801 [Helianthus anomalus]